MVSPISFFAILLLFATCVFPLPPESIRKFPKSIHRNILQKRVPANPLCAEGEQWVSRTCAGGVNELTWIDTCENQETHELHEHQGECEGGFVCMDDLDEEGDAIINCVEDMGDLINPGADSPEHENAGGFVEDSDEEDLEEEDADEGWAGEVINDPGDPGAGVGAVQRHITRWMGKTITKAAFSAMLLSNKKNFVVLPYMKIVATVGNLGKPLCVWSQASRYCEPKKPVTLWHGDRIDITYSILGDQAVNLVYAAFGPKAVLPHHQHKHIRSLLESETD